MNDNLPDSQVFDCETDVESDIEIEIEESEEYTPTTSEDSEDDEEDKVWKSKTDKDFTPKASKRQTRNSKSEGTL